MKKQGINYDYDLMSEVKCVGQGGHISCEEKC